MRSSVYTQSEFFKRMKKKPQLQKILDNLDNMSEEDIDVCRQPAWIKEELKKLKIPVRPEGYLTPEEIADLMMKSKK